MVRSDESLFDIPAQPPEWQPFYTACSITVSRTVCYGVPGPRVDYWREMWRFANDDFTARHNLTRIPAIPKKRRTRPHLNAAHRVMSWVLNSIASAMEIIANAVKISYRLTVPSSPSDPLPLPRPVKPELGNDPRASYITDNGWERITSATRFLHVFEAHSKFQHEIPQLVSPLSHHQRGRPDKSPPL